MTSIASVYESPLLVWTPPLVTSTLRLSVFELESVQSTQGLLRLGDGWTDGHTKQTR